MSASPSRRKRTPPPRPQPQPRHGPKPPRYAPGAETLARAALVIAQVALAGKSADEALLAADGREDRAAVRAITLGTLRWYLRLAPAMAQLLTRAPEEMPNELRALLVAACHQVEYSRSPPEVSVHLAVDAARVLELGHAAGFVNAVLRRFVARRAELLADVDAEIALRHAHPVWFTRSLAASWPDDFEQVLAANNLHPPMTLRVAKDRSSVADYLRELAAAGRPARSLDWSDSAIVLEYPTAVTALPGFAEGRVSIQDAGAQLAARLLDLKPGQRVLDACAAPGGKTGHILELEPRLGSLLAVDSDAERLALVSSTLERLQREAKVRAADLTDPAALADEAPFDRILLDAPCSSTGVIRRHPDIKLLRRASDIAAFATLQARILDAVFARLAVGGRLVYATCSVLPEENEQVVAAFLARQTAARVLGWPDDLALPPSAQRLGHGVQLLPGPAAPIDGFYYAVLARAEAAGLYA